MREIKFRGLDVKGNWYYGNLSVIPKKIRGTIDAGTRISNSAGMPFAYEVRPETVGQFTGLSDKLGKEIYEGDIMVSFPYTIGEDDSLHYTYWAFVDFDFGKFKLNYFKGGADHSRPSLGAECEIIGNIYENPELI